jgi:hypothetical protein
MDKCLKLEKIEMPPYFILCIMNTIILSFAIRAFESASWDKINMNI